MNIKNQLEESSKSSSQVQDILYIYCDLHQLCRMKMRVIECVQVCVFVCKRERERKLLGRKCGQRVESGRVDMAIKLRKLFFMYRLKTLILQKTK